MMVDMAAMGDPGAVTCRWCGEGKMRHGGVLLCRTCDTPAHLVVPPVEQEGTNSESD